ncbi:MAG: phosphatidylinositol-specific phospholipase C1-like protein [Spirochaetes bacterium]|nr:phosphatidylinositol-specific phospholipase C1-like protein [Spirochaetota bacterium]MBU0954881.1 phosphatidylinositol-specific phospholipase C1-like protein [Spirochaetota bacterium]
MNPKHRSTKRKVIFITVLIPLIPLTILLLAIISLKSATLFDARAQAARMRQLQQNPPAAKRLPDADIPDSLRLDQLRLLATHNSYRAKSDPLGIRLIALAKPAEPPLLAYRHQSLYSQLDSDIRSLELDLRPRGDRFVLAHVPLVDERSVAPDLAAALSECVLWSNHNPSHVPLIIILELKDDWGFLDPFARSWDAVALDRLDQTIRTALGDRLFTPDNLRGAADSVQDAIARQGWPELGSLRNRVLVVLHEDQRLREIYIEGNPALHGRAMFTCAAPGAADGGFAILNDPVADAARIAEYRAAGLIVRTRADAPPSTDPSGLQAALASGANIISTDYPPAYPHANGYNANLGGGRTINSLSTP